jgi:hypothetical protein
MLLARILNNVSVVWDTYYTKLLLVCRLRLFNPLIVFEVDSCIVMKSWTFHCKYLFPEILASYRYRSMHL